MRIIAARSGSHIYLDDHWRLAASEQAAKDAMLNLSVAFADPRAFKEVESDSASTLAISKRVAAVRIKSTGISYLVNMGREVDVNVLWELMMDATSGKLAALIPPMPESA